MSLEKNIERIADALEALAGLKGVKAGAEAKQQTPVQNDAGTAGTLPPVQNNAQGNWPPLGQMPPQGGQVPTSGPSGAGQPWNGGMPSMQQSGMPPQQQGPMGALPTSNTTQQYTFDQLAVATANLASSGKDVFPILGRFGINTLMDLPPEKFGTFAAALREAGAVI